jgi:hypothetical protein
MLVFLRSYPYCACDESLGTPPHRSVHPFGFMFCLGTLRPQSYIKCTPSRISQPRWEILRNRWANRTNTTISVTVPQSNPDFKSVIPIAHTLSNINDLGASANDEDFKKSMFSLTLALLVALGPRFGA